MQRISTLTLSLFVALILGSPCDVLAQKEPNATEDRLQKLLERFPQADANGDGKFTEEEARAYKNSSKKAVKRGKEVGKENDKEKEKGKEGSKVELGSFNDVSYGPHPRNVLDCWQAKADHPTPVLIFFHGGSFKAGDKSIVQSRPILQECLSNGISVISANFRFSTDAPFPAPMLDGARVVQFVRSKAEEWKIDPDRIAVSGSSAGATMALWVALHDDLADLFHTDPIARLSTRVQCASPHSGTAGLDSAYFQEQAGVTKLGGALWQLFGAQSQVEFDSESMRSLEREASPLTHVTRDDPPLFLTYAGQPSEAPFAPNAAQKDWIHHACLGKPLKDAYDALGLVCDFHHQANPPSDDSEIAFLKKILLKPLPLDRVIYKKNTDRDLSMTIHKPADWNSNQRRSAIIFFYNGGWKEAGATKPQFEEQAVYFAARGMVVGQADYREKSKDGPTSSKCVEDIFSAIRWMRAHADELGIDPARIAVSGGSGSIHLPAAAVVDETKNASPTEESSIDPMPGAVFSFHPDPDVLDESMMNRLIHGKLAKGAKMPPTVLYWGSRDAVAPYLAEFVAETQAAGLPIESYVNEGGVHGFYKFTPGLEASTEHMDQKLRGLGYLDDPWAIELPHKSAPPDYEERVLATQQKWLELHKQLHPSSVPSSTIANVDATKTSKPTATDAPPATSHIYQRYGERELQLMMHYPSNWKPDDRRMAILFFSGGHKVQPDKNGKLPPLAEERARLGLPVVNGGPRELHEPICNAFAERGHVAMRVNYRTRNKDGVLPGEDIADAISAIRWVRKNATILGIDPNRVVAAGGSSGGYLAASLFCFESRYPQAGDAFISARPNAIMLYSPLVDWLDVGIMSESFLVVLNGDKELGARVSPARHWQKDCPPTLVMVGSEEPPFSAVKNFAEKWKNEGAPMELFVAEGGEHGFFGKPAWFEKTLEVTDRFLEANRLTLQTVAQEAPPSKSNREANQTLPTSERLQGMLRKFPDADLNKDGTLVPSQAWDLDQDGRLSKEEFKAPAQLFLNLDTDGDGYLSGKETVKLDSKLDLDKTSQTTWVVPPETSYHGVTHHTYHSPSMNLEVGYNIYLPDDYEKSISRYPVIYHLHGSGGNESVQIDLSVVYHRAIEQKKIRPVIVVFVNGGKRSYYSDSADGKILAETTIIHELIPHIDSTYRTLADKSGRVIHGFSMGGFGTFKLGMKYPELFCAAISFSGGMASPESVHMQFLTRIVGDDEAVMKANNPADIAIRNRDALHNLTIWLFAGSRDVAREDSTWADQFLETQGIAHRFEISEDTGHALKRHFDLYGDEIFSMLEEQFAKNVAIKK